jgi:hypothetical protein
MLKETKTSVLLAKIKSLSIDYNMELDWGKINKADEKELEYILGLIKRIYRSR